MIGERIKQLRKAMGMTQAKFGERVGIKQPSLAAIESGDNTPSDQTVAFICREFRVSEAWLRTGAGDMFVPTPASIVDELADEYHLCPEAQAMVEKFITLDPAAQLAVFDYMCAVVDEIRGKARDDQLRDELERQLTKEKTAEEKSGA